MPRHTFLDSILNRPSQNYAPSKGKQQEQQRWNAPPDLPNAPASSTRGSILGGSLFRRKDKRSGASGGAGSVSNFGSEAGASTSTAGLRTRFGRKKYESSSSFLADVSGNTGNGSFYVPSQHQNVNRYPPPPSSVADSQATVSKRKSRWWEAGSLNFGRRSRAPSIAGDSIFSEPEPPPGQIPWNSHGLAGIGAGTGSRRVTRSDYGASPSRRQREVVPPLPVSPLRKGGPGSVTSSTASPAGRLQSDVAPLGVSTLNPSLNKRPSRSKLAAAPVPSGVDVRRTASSADLGRSKSPPPAASTARIPGSLAASPHVRRLSQDSKRGGGADGTDWKDFMKSMSGTEIAKTWQGTRDAPDMAQAASGARTSVNLERRKSHYERIQKELQQDAQFEQTLRDPGVVHQDLISRAASQVVGGAPPGVPDGYGGFVSDLKPGSVIPTQAAAQAASPSSTEVVQQQEELDKSTSSRDESTASEIGESSLEEQDEEAGSSDEDVERDEESLVHKQTMLDVVNEEDEDASSQGTASRRQSLKPSLFDEGTSVVPSADAPSSRFKAFEAALNKSRGSVSNHQDAVLPNVATTSPPESASEANTITSVEANDATPAVIVTTQKDDSDGEDSDGSDSNFETSSEKNGSHAAVIAEEAHKETLADDEDEDDRASQGSAQTGRATVTFEKQADDKADARSVRSVASRASRPGTLQRRLSDVSLGTSFGVSNIMQIGRSRPTSRAASSRKIKLNDGDDDSAGSRSDDEDDEELKQRIKAEQERLRNMKVGDDFFGGSLSTILDKFDSKDWNESLSATVGQLGLDVGTQGSKRNSVSAQDVLALNAQERLMEVRRQRHEGVGASPGKQQRDLSDARTVESGVAPSFAALWLLNQTSDESKSASKDVLPDSSTAKQTVTAVVTEPSSSQVTQHVRQDSNASSENATMTVSHSPPASSRIKNILGFSATSTPDKKISVMDRPRQRGPKPREMGGVSIARGKLLPDARAEEPEDKRNILSDVWIPQTLSQMKEAQAAAALSSPDRKAPSESGSAISPPVSPVAKVAPSKDKPAPAKPAIKSVIKPSLSLADTLFSFPAEKSMKGKRSLPNLKTKGKGRSVQYDGTGKGGKTKEAPEMPLPRPQEQRETKPADASSRHSHDDSSQDGRSLHTPTAVRPGNPVLQAELDDGIHAQHTILPTPKIETEQAARKTAQVEAMRYDEDPSPLSSTRSPPPASDLWSGESVVSTGPATPGVSEIFDRNAAPLQRLPYEQLPGANEVRPMPSPRDKKLPLPPVPSFEDHYYGTSMAEDATPLAVPRAEPVYAADQSKTPRAEQEEPAFGMNIIPPTPPADDVVNVRMPSIQAPETLEEEADVDGLATDEQQVEQPLQRSSSSKSKSASRTSNSLSRKSSVKRRSASSNAMHEYQGHGLSLPPGLVATTVATSASRRNSQLAEEPVDLSSDPTAKSRKPKVRSKSMKERKTRSGESTASQAAVAMQPSLSTKLASLTPPRPEASEGTSSTGGSDPVAGGISRGSSQSPSPAVSVSGRSSAVSSAVSSSAASDASSRSRGGGPTKHTLNGQQPGRKIRTVTTGPNGHARTSLMSAISEWESSPIDVDRSQSASPMQHAVTRSSSGYASPVPQAQFMNATMAGPSSGYQSPVYTGASSVTRSQSSIYSGSSPSLVRNAPVGAPTDALLQPGAAPGANRRLSVPASDFAPWGTSYTGGEESEGGHSHYSAASLPNVPQSSYRARDPHKSSNVIDDRLYAKTTMATVAVTSGAFRQKSIKGRKSSVDLRHHDEAGQNPSGGRRSSMDVSAAAEGMLVDELQRTTMALTSHTAPPRKLNSTQVLVQVIACAIDEMDKLLLREKVRNETAYGFIPGRSFCGRVMETGWEVKRMRRGDIVFGLQNSRKCGALAEFMTIEEDLVAKAPQDCLTMEQIAALPSVGVMAHQLMINHCSQLKRGSRILILNAHDGVGLLAMQECATLGLIIVAHCPNQVSDGVAICEANGAHEVIVGEPLWALNTLHESSLDLVVDTVGGRRVYDASRRILAFGGQFCTFFGDLHSSGANPNLRSHLRSLRRSFFKKDAKQIGYEWVGTDTAEDCREALEAVRRAAEDGLICPRLKSVLAFGEGARAFENTLRGAEEEPGATVVRIS